MDCVYQAYCDWLEYNNQSANMADYYTYVTLKYWTHGMKPQYTFGAVVPWILRSLMLLHDFTWLEVQYRIYTPDHLFEVAQKEYSFGYVIAMMNAFKYLRAIGKPVENITLVDSIYLLLNSQHAVFSQKIPKYGTPVMAIKGHKGGLYG